MNEYLMTLDEDEISAVRALWGKVTSMGNVGSETYNRLFYLNPEVRDMFKTDMGTQAQIFADSISHFIDNIEDPTKVSDHFATINLTHIQNNISHHHYVKLYEAMIYVFKTHIKELDNNTLESWSKFYWGIVEKMKAN